MLTQLSVNGVRLGNTRIEVESIVGEPAKCNNPAWNRYGPRRDLLVLYRPAWPQTNPEAWTALIVVGNQLERDGEVLVSTGSGLDDVLALLGPPLEQGCREADTSLWEYQDFFLTVDHCTERVLSVGLKRYVEPEAGDPKRRWFLTDAGAIAC